ncbi:hypothetical protein KC19_2G065500 [Ceratodon purpureus]|uniref:PIH1 N-terminal domain-containing protein n=1 Tax=Ceratodon purpureus TaxID=3225 RepID=A0A8T0ITK2_CERPU|nr:hypothetical protein KC19_2G065500 [Ceratodon purpureus]
MAAMECEGPELLDHLKELDLTKEEMSRFSKCFKEPEFKEMFMNYVKEISDSNNKEAMENHLKQCEQNAQNPGKSPMEGKDLLLPYTDFCIKTHDLKEKKKVFINFCYCDKVVDCKSCEDPKRNGTEWEIPYSLGGPSEEKDKAGKECIVYDFIVGAKTHENANDSKPFKKFLILTAIEAIEKQKDVQLEKNYSLPLMKYKGKNGSKEARIFTIKKVSSSKNSQDNNDSKKIIKNTSKIEKDRVTKKDDKNNDVKREIVEQSCTSNVEKNNNFNEEEWEKEITPEFEVFYRNTVDYSKYWADPKVKDKNTLPETLVLSISLPNVIHLKYNVDKLRSQAQWKKETHKLVITLPIESRIEETLIKEK